LGAVGGINFTFSDYRLQATTVIATTTAVDNAALGTTVAPDDGANTPPPSAKYLASDDARVIMAGAYETVANENAMAPKNSRVWWTPVLGDADVGDDERILNTAPSMGLPMWKRPLWGCHSLCRLSLLLLRPWSGAATMCSAS
jgi:hypothetical protein